MYRSPLDRFLGATLGAYLGEALKNRPIAPEFDFSDTPRARLLSLALERPEPGDLFTQLDPTIDIEEAVFLALLPDLLRWYENPTRWQRRLEDLAGTIPTEAIADYTLWGSAVSLLLRGRTPERLLRGLPRFDTPLSRQLENVDEERSRRNRLDPRVGAIAASLSTFLRTPEDFSLCLRRAYRYPCQRPITTILTGIGSGLYNGLTGVPMSWRVRGRNEPLWQEIERRVRELHARWSGVDPTNRAPLPPSIAVATAGTIQPRENFRPVSREDF